MRFSSLILSNLSRKIDAGYPLTAIATANQYLNKNCPIRRALVLKASKRISTLGHALADKNAKKIFKGEQIAEAGLSKAIGHFDRGVKKSIGKIPSKFRRLHVKRRAPSRGRKNSSSLHAFRKVRISLLGTNR